MKELCVVFWDPEAARAGEGGGGGGGGGKEECYEPAVDWLPASIYMLRCSSLWAASS